jgi:hypothetical protein
VNLTILRVRKHGLRAAYPASSRAVGLTFFISLWLLPFTGAAFATDSLKTKATWNNLDAAEMATRLRVSLDAIGIAPAEMDLIAEKFLSAIESEDSDPLDALIDSTQSAIPLVETLATELADDPTSAAQHLDPNTPGYAAIEVLPKSFRMSVRTWLGRELVRRRLYDEALPIIAEVDPLETIDPATLLFFRGACYHALLMKKESLVDLRRLLENEDQSPRRFVRTAKLMVADIKPLKEDSLDEISRLMTDVTRRLDLGRSDEKVAKQEQAIIDKLTKLIEEIEKKQQQQQQQQQAGGGSGQGDPKDGSASPMEDSRIAGGSGNGDVDKKNIAPEDGWGNLPPAERKEALQQISQDLPTHYRDAIEAYFRKLATQE